MTQTSRRTGTAFPTYRRTHDRRLTPLSEENLLRLGKIAGPPQLDLRIGFAWR